MSQATLSMRRVEPADTPAFDAYPDRMIYHTREWMGFIAETQDAEPVVAEVKDGGAVVGLFHGLIFRRYGLRLFGSPFPGWTTMYMGFNLDEGVARHAAVKAAADFVHRELGCVHMELVDRNITAEMASEIGFRYDFVDSYETDLTQSEDEIFGSMRSACRRCIRKAEKSGVQIEEGGDEQFADQYYHQLEDVFLKQGLVPTYGVDRVRALIKWLYPTGNLLLLRARDPEGNCIATGIYPGMNKTAQFWGNASYRASQGFRPNEALHWHAMRYWKKRGAHVFDWGGGGTYKEKYGCARLEVPRLMIPKYEALLRLRDASKRLVESRQRFLGRMASKRQ